MLHQSEFTKGVSFDHEYNRQNHIISVCIGSHSVLLVSWPLGQQVGLQALLLGLCCQNVWHEQLI